MIGIIGLWGFIGHIFYAEKTAKLIGWKSNGFQWEVGMTDLSLGVMGILSSFDSYFGNFQLATIIFSTIFLWGAAVNHLYECIYYKNYSPLNSDIVLIYDIITPIILIHSYLNY